MIVSRRWPALYLLIVSAVFLVSYVLLGVRELGLALLLLVLNLPASAATLPLSERISSALDVTAGSAAHVWATQGATMALNALLLYASIRAIRGLRNR